MTPSCHRFRVSRNLRPAAPLFEHRLDLRPSEADRSADTASVEPEAGKVAALEAVENGPRTQAEQIGQLAGGEQALAHAGRSQTS